MNSSVRVKPIPRDPNGEPPESRQQKLSRIRAQVSAGFYSRTEVLRDVADALMMNPAPFENLAEKEE